MKKLLLGTAAVAMGMSLVATPASAQISLDLGGHMKGYVTWLDQDEGGNDTTGTVGGENVDVRAFEIQRDTEIHFSGETTLDNGLTVGFHTEARTDGTDTTLGDSFNVEESYAYFSGAWGRVNFGAEDGATYLLQVAAPSADTNVDGLRQYINPIRHQSLDFNGSAANGDTIRFRDIFFTGTAANAVVVDAVAGAASATDILVGAAGAGTVLGRRLDYDHNKSGFENKLTYMTPVFNGFQGGLSYTPEVLGGQGAGLNTALGFGNSLDDVAGAPGEVWELAARWEGMVDQVGIAIGGGYSNTELEQDITPTAGGAEAVFFRDVDASGTFTAGDVVTATLDDREAWNVGIDLDWKAFGLGGGYMEDDNGVSGDAFETETWFVGVDYTTGPFKIGASYLDQEQNIGGADVETDRWTGGVVYTYGPGMTFRGSVSFTDFEENLGAGLTAGSANSDVDATSVLLGTQINF